MSNNFDYKQCQIGYQFLKGWFSHNISAMHMAPSTKMQLSSNSNRVMVVVDWEDRKVNRDIQKITAKLTRRIVSLVQCSDTGYFLETSGSIAGLEQASDQGMWQSHGSGNWYTKEMFSWTDFDWLDFLLLCVSLETQVQLRASIQASWACPLVNVAPSYAEPRVGYESLQSCLWPCRG